MCMKVKLFGHVQTSCHWWTVDFQAPLSTGFPVKNTEATFPSPSGSSQLKTELWFPALQVDSTI